MPHNKLKLNPPKSNQKQLLYHKIKKQQSLNSNQKQNNMSNQIKKQRKLASKKYLQNKLHDYFMINRKIC